MRAIRHLLPACLLMLLPGTSVADVSLGTNLGLMIHSVTGASENTTIFEWPNSARDLQPGLRLGIRPSNEHHEVYLNSGVIYTSRGGNTGHMIEATANYQYNFSPADAASAYFTAGGGLLAVGGSSESSSTSGLFGAGLGTRFRVAEGHGSLRAELRYDRLGESARVAEADMFGIRFGFDLWMK